MGVSKNNATPKWMVKIKKNPIKMDDLGGKQPLFLETPMTSSCPGDEPASLGPGGGRSKGGGDDFHNFSGLL